MVTPEQAVAHPNWDMGAKISIDSATMMNKGLELIEAYHLFPVSEEKIEILVHPQSVVHSLVDYVDGSVLAQMGTPDMRTPISFALGWPQRLATHAPGLNLQEIGNLSFEDPDEERFPALRLAREALKKGGSAPTILNAANEIAVEGFLNKKINFLEIAAIVENTLENAPHCELMNLRDVLDADFIARNIAKNYIMD
jgi:1-deoxy-D-xylulose-5-phosphate reductoisomerase